MAEFYEKGIYERLIPSWIPLRYWVFWPLVALIGASGGHLILVLTSEPQFPLTSAMFGLLFGMLPPWCVWLRKAFEDTVAQLTDITAKLGSDLDVWKKHQVSSVFTFSSLSSRVVVLFIVTGGIGVVLGFGLPFDSTVVNALAVIGFVPLLFLCGHAAFILARLIVAVWVLLNRPPQVPFYFQFHPSLGAFRAFLLQVALTGTGLYGLLCIAVWRGPYGLHIALQVWLYVIAVYPMVWVLVSLIGIRRLVRTAQIAAVRDVNALVQQALNNCKEKPSEQAAAKLHDLMRCQSLVEAQSAWSPVLLASVLVALLTAAAQVIVTFLQGMAS